MTNFENDTLYTLLCMKSKELKEFSEKEEIQQFVDRKAISELSEFVNRIRGDIYYVDNKIRDWKLENTKED